MIESVRDGDCVNVVLSMVKIHSIDTGSAYVTLPGIAGKATHVPLVGDSGDELRFVTIERALPDVRPCDVLVARQRPELGRFFVHAADGEYCVTMGDGTVHTLERAVGLYGMLIPVDLAYDDPPMYADLAGGHEPAGEFRPFEPAMERHPGDEGLFDRPVPVSDRTQVLPPAAVLPPARGTAVVS